MVNRSLEIKSRSAQLRREAREHGRKTFFAAAPCSRGHSSERWVSSGSCVACGKLTRSTHVRTTPVRSDEQVKIDKKRSSKYYSANAEAMREKHKQYRLSNPDVRKAIHHKRRSRKMGADGWFTSRDIASIRVKQRGRCALCRVPLRKQHIDHVIPLARGGTNYPKNIQLLCPTCNVRKSAKDPIVFSQEMGLLL